MEIAQKPSRLSEQRDLILQIIQYFKFRTLKLVVHSQLNALLICYNWKQLIKGQLEPYSGSRYLSINAFDSSQQSSDFISRRKTTNDCLKSLTSQSEIYLFIGGGNQPWEGVVKKVEIYGKILTLNELKYLLVKQKYPQFLFKGNYIGGQNELDVEFRNQEIYQYTQSSLRIREDTIHTIDQIGRISSQGKALYVQNFTIPSSLFIEAWFHFLAPQTFEAFTFGENDSCLSIGDGIAVLYLDRITHKYQVPLFEGWNYISLQSMKIDSTSEGFLYFVVNSFVSPVFERQTSFIKLRFKVGSGFTGHLNRLRLSYQPRGRRSYYFVGRETPLCQRTQYYDGTQCLDCHYTCPYCASLGDAYCFENTPPDTLFAICPVGYNYMADQAYCKPNETCLQYKLESCVKCAQDYKLRAGICVEQCLAGEMETLTECRFALGFETASLISRNVLVLEYKDEILTNDELFAFLSSEIFVSFSKSLNFRLVLLTPKMTYQKKIEIKVEVMDTIYQNARVQMQVRIRKRDAQGNQDRQTPFVILSSILKPQFSQDQKSQIAEFNEATQTTLAAMGGVMSFNFLAGILLDLSLKQLWGLINIAQLLSYQLIVCVPKPYNLVVLLQNLIFANGDLMIVHYFGDLLNLPLFEKLEEQFTEEPFECFEQADFESSSFLLNQEISLYFVGLYLGVIVPISCILTKLCSICRFNCALYFIAKFKTFYNSAALERLLLELYLDISISVFIGMSLFKIDTPLQMVDFAFRIASLFILLLGYLVLKIIKLIKLHRRRNLHPAQSEEGAIKQKQEIQEQFLTVIFVLNRFCFAAIVVFLKDYILIECLLLLALFLSQIFLAIFSKCLPSNSDRLTLLIENCLLFLIIIIFILFKYQAPKWSVDTFVYIGYCPVLLIMSSFVVGLCKLVFKTIKEIKDQCKKCRAKKDKKVKVHYSDRTLPKSSTSNVLDSQPIRIESDNLQTTDHAQFQSPERRRGHGKKKRVLSTIDSDRLYFNEMMSSRSCSRKFSSRMRVLGP